MEYILIGICLILAVCLLIFLFKKTDKKNEDVLMNTEGSLVSSPANEKNYSNDLVIQMEMLPSEYKIDENQLVEIKDNKVLAHVNNLVPGLAQVGNVANNAVQAAQTNGETLYRAILPAGAKLADSKAMEGAVRGFYNGTEGIKGHANWMTVETQNATTAVANTAAAAMGVASMVVGQYYMTQINAELGEISDGISKISDFQDNEYRSRVFSLIAHVKKISDFQVEILENNELRLSKITQLDGLEEECTQLLGQANLTLVDYAKKSEFEFNDYEKKLKKANVWYEYQQSLLDILYKISDLRYTLHMGYVSREQCSVLLPIYSKQVVDTQARITSWHQKNTNKLNIDIEGIRRKRVGVDKAIYFIPGLIKDDLNFRELEENTVNMIRNQISGNISEYRHDQSELYQQDVNLISKGGKVYYLPETKME